jgi:glycosyltransferase involved in cell wall biosynthesis/peptidoglycan/xylan/chitin deacetylase (PgdA/CDA1 family)
VSGLKRRLGEAVAAVPPMGRFLQRLRGLGTTVFMFHRILPEGETCYDVEMTTSTRLFESFLDWVSAEYRVLPMEELAARSGGLKNGAKPICALTFDDGWRDNFVHAFPLLQRCRLPATIFVPVRFIGSGRRFWQERLRICLDELDKRNEIELKVSHAVDSLPWCPRLTLEQMTFSALRRLLLTRPSTEADAFVERLEESMGPLPALEGRAFLDWQEVAEMQNSGISFGSHTLHHTLLTRAGPATAAREIHDSREELADRLGARPVGFSYPWGAKDKRIEQQVRDAGYAYAVTTRVGLVNAPLDPWSLPRLPISSSFFLRGHTEEFNSRLVSLYVGAPTLKRNHRLASTTTQVSSERIRIAFVIDSIDSWEDGGTEQQIAKFITALDPVYFAVELYFLRPSRGLFADDFLCPVHVASWKTPGSGSRWATVRALADLLKLQRPHIVQTFFRDGTYYGVAAAKIARVPRIVIARRNFGHWKATADRAALKLVNRLAHAWQCNSRAVWESLRRDEGVPPDRIEILPNAIDLNRFSPPTQEERLAARRQLSLPDSAPVLVSVATLFPVKDPRTLIEAAALVRSALPNVQFLLVGEGPLRDEMSRRIEELGLTQSVRLLGAQRDVRPYLAAADMGLLTSRSEASSNSLLEYMAMGLPAIVSDLQANRELVGGMFFSAGNPPELSRRVISLCQDTAERARLSTEYRRRAWEFGLDAFACRSQSYYVGLMGAMPSASGQWKSLDR